MGGPGGVVDGGSGGHGYKPTGSVNDMLRTMAFTSRQTGGSFLVRHEDQDKGVWLYHLGGEEGVVNITQRVSLPMSVWLDANCWNVAWPTAGEQLEDLQNEADEHIKALFEATRIRF